MTQPEETLVALVALLDRLHIPYMVIGGLANAVWGEPRATLDVDVTVSVPEAELDRVIGQVGKAFAVRVPEPFAFVKHTRVLPLQDERGVQIDLIFGMLPFEEQAIERARPVSVAGTSVRFCTPEDLILHKIISDRPKDLSDARGVTRRNLQNLDLAYLEPRIRDLSQLLERAEIWQRWQEWTADLT